jgi:hypothetical protein
MSKLQALNAVIESIYVSGHSVQAIADALNLSKRSVTAKLVRGGVYRRGLPPLDAESFGE